MRTRSTRTVAVVVAIAALAACAPPPPPDTTAADTAAINALRDAWVTAFNAADVDSLVNLYTEDAIDLPANEPTLSGRAAIREYFVTTFGMGKATATVTSEELQLMGDWAYDRGTFTLSIVPAAGGEAMNVSQRYLVVIRQQADGAWKLARLIDNSPTPPAPMPAAGS
jgi:uncharacterized protein (TIGR02246 family)